MSMHAAIAIGLASYAVLVVIASVIIAWACCAVAGRADRAEQRDEL